MLTLDALSVIWTLMGGWVNLCVAKKLNWKLLFLREVKKSIT